MAKRRFLILFFSLLILLSALIFPSQNSNIEAQQCVTGSSLYLSPTSTGAGPGLCKTGLETRVQNLGTWAYCTLKTVDHDFSGQCYGSWCLLSSDINNNWTLTVNVSTSSSCESCSRGGLYCSPVCFK